MNLGFAFLGRLLLVALLVGGEWCSSAHASDESNAERSQEAAPSLSSGLTFGMPQIVLRGSAQTPSAMETCRPLPQDSGHLAACARFPGAAARFAFGSSLLGDGPVVTESTLLLQHTRLQL